MQVQIKINGRTYTVRGDESGDEIQAVAGNLDHRMAELSRQMRTSDDYTIAVMVALNLASELHRLKQDVAHRMQDLDREAAGLVAMLEAALPPEGAKA